MACQIKYTPVGGSLTTLTLVNSPVNFMCSVEGRVNDNLSTSGKVRERVIENLDLMLTWEMPYMQVQGDIEAWAAFTMFALGGGQFAFLPCSMLSDAYNCVAEDTGWQPQYKGPKRYGAKVKVRILQDSSAPGDPSVVLRRFYGVTP